MHDAHVHDVAINTTRLPVERRVRYAFDLALVAHERREVDRAITTMLAAENLAPEQVHHHVMGQQIVSSLRHTNEGRASSELAQLAERMHAPRTNS